LNYSSETKSKLEERKKRKKRKELKKLREMKNHPESLRSNSIKYLGKEAIGREARMRSGRISCNQTQS
jgi:hypothetical protein